MFNNLQTIVLSTKTNAEQAAAAGEEIPWRNARWDGIGKPK